MNVKTPNTYEVDSKVGMEINVIVAEPSNVARCAFAGGIAAAAGLMVGHVAIDCGKELVRKIRNSRNKRSSQSFNRNFDEEGDFREVDDEQ